MHIDVNGAPTYCYTGGKAFNPALPTVLFIHGVLNDHSVWILQSRYLANHHWNVLALDLPGQSRSAGEPPASVEQGAQFVVALLDALHVRQAALVGHSLGALIALQTAALAPDRVSQLVLVGAAFPMKVSPALLEASLHQPEKAIAMVNVFSHASLAPPPSTLGPGTWLYGGSRALMRRVLASNREVNLFHRGFLACDGYTGGDAAMAGVKCRVLFVLGKNDQMAPPRAARSLMAAAPHGQRVLLDSGHSLMTERPDGVLDALLDFLKPTQAA